MGDRNYDVNVRFNESVRGNPEAISNLTISSPERCAYSVVRCGFHQNRSRRKHDLARDGPPPCVSQTGFARTRLATFLAEAQRSIESNIKYDHEKYEITWGGQFENQQRAQARLTLIIPAVLGLIFLILFAAFGHARYAAIIMLTVPLALVGGLAALQLRGMTLNVSSAVGFIALFGVAVQNGVIMVSNLNRWRATGVDLKEAVRRGAGERLRPVLMTATVATLGLLPAALAHAIGSDVQRPLATVIVGGLITATALTLLILPAVYYVVEKRLDTKAADSAGQI